METIEKSIHIDATPGAVYQFIDETENAMAWVPSMISVHNIQGSGQGKKYEWTYRMAGVKFDGRSEVMVARPSSHYQTKSSGGVQSTWDYDIQPDGQGSKLRLRVQYEIPAPVLGRIAERMLLRRNEREAEMGLQNIKDLVEHRASAKKVKESHAPS